MDVRLLKKLRRQGRNQINILSITKSDDIVIGMRLSYNDKKYAGLFTFGDTEEEVKKKAEHIYISEYLSINKFKSHR